MNINVRAFFLRRRELAFQFLAGAMFLVGLAVTRAAEPVVITSLSKQFAVRGKPQTSVFASNPKADLVYIDPAVLAVTCERIKQILATELGWGDRWRGTIYVNVHPVRSDNERPEIYPFQTDQGWRYRVEMPDEIIRTRLLQAIIEVLLLEFANRAATEETVVLPPWLVEGLTAHLISGSLSSVALSPSAFNVRLKPRNDSAATLRQQMLEAGTLTVDQLNWPTEQNREPGRDLIYQHSAQLFVRELLRLRGGPDALCATLALLPEHLNWQTAFLRGFESHFQRMLDVEKWWSLQLAQLQTRENSVLWSTGEARQRLEEILYTPLQVQLADEELPHVTPVALQTVLNDWNFSQQSPLLQNKLNQLRAARVRLTPELAALTDGYATVLEKYLQARSHEGRFFRERKARAAVAGAVQELNNLDLRRAKISNSSRVANAAGVVPLTPP